MRVTYTLPIPPSVNGVWRTFKGRTVVSKACHDWRELAWGEILKAGKESVEPPFRVELVVHGGKGFKRSRDLDNIAKVPIDLLRAAKVIPGDSVSAGLLEVVIRYAKANGPARLVVTVEHLDSTPAGQ